MENINHPVPPNILITQKENGKAKTGELSLEEKVY